MAKLFWFLLIVGGNVFPVNGQNATKMVLATASIFADMAENIAGGHLEIKTIVPIGGDPHIYEPTPGDVQLVVKANLILKNGLTFEGWIDGLIAGSGSKAKVVTITNGINPVQAVYKNSYDPHAWMDASNGLIYIENIKNAFVELDPANREVYEFNYKAYRQQLEDLDRYIFEQVKKIPETRRILITSHDAFQYYGRRYGVRLESVIGVSTEANAQTSDIQRLNKVIRENQVPAVFIETTVNPKLLEQVARDNHVTIGGKLFSDSIGEKNSAAPTYLDMLKQNTNVIVAALGKTPETQTNTRPEGKPVNWLLVAAIFLGLVASFWLVWKKSSI